MTKTKAFVVGDIHGMYHSLKVMLSHWRRDEEQLIMVGDYIDRGPQSFEVIKYLYDLQQQEDITLLRGNHEQLLLNYLTDPAKEYRLYEHNGGIDTLAQILNVSSEEILKSDPVKIAQAVTDKEPWLLGWLEGLVFYTVFGQHIIVHAGVDFSKEDWRHTSLKDFLWIRDPFHWGVNKLNRPIIFGHTPVQTLHDNFDPWVNDNKWGIDGGCVYGGSLIALRINETKVVQPVILR